MRDVKPDLDQARRFAEAIHKAYPNKFLAYNCSPSFNWRANLDEATMRSFREALAAMGYRFEFITLAGWHALNSSMFNLSRAYKAEGMYAYSQLQEREFEDEQHGFRAVKHQSFRGGPAISMPCKTRSCRACRRRRHLRAAPKKNSS